MIPIKISISGFMSIRETQNMIFEGARLWVVCHPKKRDIHLVADAISFVLFDVLANQQTMHVKMIHPDCEQAEVIFDFREEGVFYRVRRAIHKNGSAVCGAFILTPSSETERFNPEKITGTDDKDGFKTWAAEKPGLNDAVIKTCLLLLPGQGSQLMDATPAERCEILTKWIDFLGSDVLTAGINGEPVNKSGDAFLFCEEGSETFYEIEKELLKTQERLGSMEGACRTAMSRIIELSVAREEAGEDAGDLQRKLAEAKTKYTDLEADYIKEEKKYQTLIQCRALEKKVYEAMAKLIKSNPIAR